MVADTWSKLTNQMQADHFQRDGSARVLKPLSGRGPSSPELAIRIRLDLRVLKPDALQRGLAGRIITRFEEKGFQVLALKAMQVPRELAEKHYAVHKAK